MDDKQGQKNDRERKNSRDRRETDYGKIFVWMIFAVFMLVCLALIVWFAIEGRNKKLVKEQI